MYAQAFQHVKPPRKLPLCAHTRCDVHAHPGTLPLPLTRLYEREYWDYFDTNPTFRGCSIRICTVGQPSSLPHAGIEIPVTWVVVLVTEPSIGSPCAYLIWIIQGGCGSLHVCRKLPFRGARITIESHIRTRDYGATPSWLTLYASPLDRVRLYAHLSRLSAATLGVAPYTRG